MASLRADAAEAERPFKVGDLVRLKSGGPVMTVEMIQADGGVMVVWADIEYVMQRDGFLPEMLEAVKE